MTPAAAVYKRRPPTRSALSSGSRGVSARTATAGKDGCATAVAELSSVSVSTVPAGAAAATRRATRAPKDSPTSVTRSARVAAMTAPTAATAASVSSAHEDVVSDGRCVSDATV